MFFCFLLSLCIPRSFGVLVQHGLSLDQCEASPDDRELSVDKHGLFIMAGVTQLKTPLLVHWHLVEGTCFFEPNSHSIFQCSPRSGEKKLETSLWTASADHQTAGWQKQKMHQAVTPGNSRRRKRNSEPGWSGVQEVTPGKSRRRKIIPESNFQLNI